MTTTHTQPAGCDLDSQELGAIKEAAKFAWAYGKEELHAMLEKIVARAAQAPQGDTRQGAPDEEIAPYELKRLHKLLSIAGVAGPETLDAAASMACFWALIGEITNKLSATPAAHTCTPADERAKSAVAALPEAWEKLADGFAAQGGAIDIAEAASMRNDAKELREAIAKDTRAAQGAGTAPVDASQAVENPGHKDCYCGGWTDDAGDFHNVGCPEIDAPAPVSTAAATTASASLDDDEVARLRRVVRALAMESEVPADDATLRGALFAVLGQIARKLETRAPSRAADGQQGASPELRAHALKLDAELSTLAQQGASRAALDDDTVDRLHKLREEVAMMYMLLDDGEWAEHLAVTPEGQCLETAITKLVGKANAALARAPLPAQADGQGGAA